MNVEHFRVEGGLYPATGHRFNFGVLLFDYDDDAQGALLTSTADAPALTWHSSSGHVLGLGAELIAAAFNNGGDDGR